MYYAQPFLSLGTNDTRTQSASSFAGIDKCLEMLNLSPSSYRNVDDGDRPVNTKKIYSRRPWYALPIDPAQVLRSKEDSPSKFQLS